MRLKRLVKDIATKVNYVNVVDAKIQDMETDIEGTTLALSLLEEEKYKLESLVLEYENR